MFFRGVEEIEPCLILSKYQHEILPNLLGTPLTAHNKSITTIFICLDVYSDEMKEILR